MDLCCSASFVFCPAHLCFGCLLLLAPGVQIYIMTVKIQCGFGLLFHNQPNDRKHKRELREKKIF